MKLGQKRRNGSSFGPPSTRLMYHQMSIGLLSRITFQVLAREEEMRPKPQPAKTMRTKPLVTLKLQ
jgi:hypothetical protein